MDHYAAGKEIYMCRNKSLTLCEKEISCRTEYICISLDNLWKNRQFLTVYS